MKSKQDGDYQTISITMKLMCADAGPAIERKWMEFDKDESECSKCQTIAIFRS